jgi:hypothetical protein
LNKGKPSETVAVVVDFFGVKGRLEEEIPEAQLGDDCRSEGRTACEVEIR